MRSQAVSASRALLRQNFTKMSSSAFVIHKRSQPAPSIETDRSDTSHYFHKEHPHDMSGIQSVSVSAAQSYASVGVQSQQSLQPFANLDLTEAQRTQLRSIFSAAKQNGTSQADVESQVNAVLTPAQQQALATDIKADGGRSGRHHHQAAQSSSTSQASAAESATSASASSATTVLAAVTNIQNQAVAAQSTLLDNLQQQVLSQNGTAANE
jgi:hypothetical protein